MPRSPRSILASAGLAASLLAAGGVRAQTLSPTVTASGQVNPDRLVNGKNVGPGERPSTLNPIGISYSDCTRDITLRFYVNMSGFNGQGMQVWATRTGDCTAATARGQGQVPTCWLVNGGVTAFQSTTNSTQTFDIRVQDLVGPQNAPTQPAGSLVHQGPAACNTQQTYAAVPFDIWFLPLTGGNTYSAGGYDYTMQVDMQGPPPPAWSAQNALQSGDTLFQLSWVPNVDTDTTGYDVFMDPIPGSSYVPIGGGTVQVCPAEAGSAVDASADAGVEASDDATAVADASDDATAAADTAAPVADAAAAPVADAGSPLGCFTKNVIPEAGSCTSTILGQGFVADASAVSTAVTDDAGNVLDGGTTTGTGGNSQIPTANLVGANSVTGTTISGKSVGFYTVTNLVNGDPYNVAVAAVDGFGNVGPPSAQLCDSPQPVDDFFKKYREAGGGGGGGFCTVEAAGAPVDLTILAVPVAGAAFGLARRRRRRES